MRLPWNPTAVSHCVHVLWACSISPVRCLSAKLSVSQSAKPVTGGTVWVYLMLGSITSIASSVRNGRMQNGGSGSVAFGRALMSRGEETHPTSQRGGLGLSMDETVDKACDGLEAGRGGAASKRPRSTADYRLCALWHANHDVTGRRPAMVRLY